MAPVVSNLTNCRQSTITHCTLTLNLKYLEECLEEPLFDLIYNKIGIDFEM